MSKASRVPLVFKSERSLINSLKFLSRRLSARKRDAMSMPLERETAALRNKLANMASGDEVSIASLQHLLALNPCPCVDQ